MRYVSKSLRKILDPLKDIYEGLLRCTNIFDRLTSSPNPFEAQALRDVGKDTDLGEDSDTSTCEYHFRERKHLCRRC